jgi:hypothetical protein
VRYPRGSVTLDRRAAESLGALSTVSAPADILSGDSRSAHAAPTATKTCGHLGERGVRSVHAKEQADRELALVFAGRTSAAALKHEVVLELSKSITGLTQPSRFALGVDARHDRSA